LSNTNPIKISFQYIPRPSTNVIGIGSSNGKRNIHQRIFQLYQQTCEYLHSWCN